MPICLDLFSSEGNSFLEANRSEVMAMASEGVFSMPYHNRGVGVRSILEYGGRNPGMGRRRA